VISARGVAVMWRFILSPIGLQSGYMASDKQKALDVIANEIEGCELCKVNKTGLAVPGEGSPNAKVVFVGEAPGKEEAKTGRPFVGRSGKVLRSLIAALGYKEEDVFITSPVKRLPVHVTPTEEEIDHGRTHLDAQLAIIKPKVVVMLGRVAGVALLKQNFSIGRDHGTIIEKEGRTYFLTYHPAAPLYSPSVKAELVKDFNKLKKFLKNGGKK